MVLCSNGTPPPRATVGLFLKGNTSEQDDPAAARSPSSGCRLFLAALQDKGVFVGASLGGVMLPAVTLKCFIEQWNSRWLLLAPRRHVMWKHTC